jgi:hypothetical protein
MQQYYNAQQVRRLYDSPSAWATATEPERARARARLLATVLAAMRARYPADADEINACAWQGHPMAALWRHPQPGQKTIVLMVEMGLLLPLPPHVARALPQADNPWDEADEGR